MGSDFNHPNRAVILARRERFMVGALAGVGLSAVLNGCDTNSGTCVFARRNLPPYFVEAVGCEYHVCLSIDFVPDAGAADAGVDAADGATGHAE